MNLKKNNVIKIQRNFQLQIGAAHRISYILPYQNNFISQGY